MLESAAPRAVVVSSDILQEVHGLYAQGLYLRAYQRAKDLGPLREWRGTAARILAGRLAMNLGAPRLGWALHAWAWRQDRRDPQACYYHARTVCNRRGPWRGWKFVQSCGDFEDAPPKFRADWLAFRAGLVGRQRDFINAEAWLDQAERLAPDRPWICIERANVFECQDRYADALAAARRALEVRPWHRAGVQRVAHALQLCDRDAEALELLSAADERLECGGISAQLGILQTELGLYAEAQRSFERYAERSPLLEKEVANWLAARRSDMAYFLGDLGRAAAFARQVEVGRRGQKDPFYAPLAERLSQPPADGKRHMLPVGFVRQHYKTCAPATLAALSRFWSMPADHLEIAAAICYDGTPAHSERRWAVEHGFAAREFTVTWNSAVALLERGIPFTMCIVEATFAHLQAVFGYDSVRGTLLVRDPTLRNFMEYGAAWFLKRYEASGPRGMALVPQERAHLLEGLTLPDAELHDDLDGVNRALESHDRPRARAIYETMKQRAPDHRLTWQARRSLAGYDANPAEALIAFEGLLKLYPDDAPLLVGKIQCLRDLARRDERLALLERLAEAPRVDASPIAPGANDAVFRQMYADELAVDAREGRRALRLLRHWRPGWPVAYFSLANVLWSRREFEDALTLYRWCASIQDTDERLAQTYFNAARWLRHTDVALAFLKDRFQRFGARSGWPARTLFWAYTQLEEAPEAFEMLESALRLRPDDGWLRLFAAEMHGSYGHMEQATQLLAAAEGTAPRNAWLRTSAWLATLQGARDQALAHWREVLEVEPLALDAHRAIVQLLAETERRGDGLDHLRQTCERFPHHYPLHQLWIEWLRPEGWAAAEPVIRKLVEIHPADSWARRELALALGEQGRLDEAFAELEVAFALDPNNTWYWSTRGRLCALAGRRADARTALREAIRLSVDSDFALHELIAVCDTVAERRAAFVFIAAELQRQVTFGQGLLTYRELGRHTLAPEELLDLLRQAHGARPDLWHAWAALIRQLTEMKRLDEAHDLAVWATARFPLLPALWLELSLVCQARKDDDGEIGTIRHALEINPAWGDAVRMLATAHRRRGRLADAKEAMESGIRRAPLDHLNHGWLAEYLWLLGEKEAALERVQQALRLAAVPYDWAWSALSSWSQQLGKPQVAADFARELTRKRGSEARSWLMLARVLFRPEDLDERLAALDRALALNPYLVEAYDLRAESLAVARRFDEAASACHAAVWQGQPPLMLRGRAAWIEAWRGNVTGAIERMRALVSEDPAYWWGWNQLGEWYRQQGTPAQYQEAADAMVRLAPYDAVSLGFQGDARLRSGDRVGAKAALRQAITYAPDYAFGGFTLFDAQLADRELEEAARTLEHLQKHTGGDFVTARAVQLAVARHDAPQAEGLLAQLCLSVGAAGWPLDTAVNAFVQAGWSGATEDIIDKALGAPNVAPYVGTLWVHRCVARGDWSCAKRLSELLARGDVGQQALAAFVCALGDARRSWQLGRVIRRYRDHLQGSTYCWGVAGYALAATDQHRAAARWMADHEARKDVAPWMLLNLAVALRARGADDEATRIQRRAVELPPDHSWLCHRVWLALEAALAGSPTAADELAVVASPATLDPAHRFVHALACGIVDVSKADAANRRQAFRAARQRLSQAALECRPLVYYRGAVRRAYRRAVRCIARGRGGFMAGLWGLWRRMSPHLPPPV